MNDTHTHDMALGKAIFIFGGNAMEIDDTAKLLQDFIKKVSPADLRRLLTKVRDNPKLVKQALKFL